MLNTIRKTVIQFPEIVLYKREAHFLRGYFGNLFKEQSPLLHNHFNDGKLIYQYPLVQYKILGGVPTLVGLGEGALLLLQLFTEVKQLVISGNTYPVYEKNISTSLPFLGVENELYQYSFETLWMALNQNNYGRYLQTNLGAEKNQMLQKILIGHIISFYKAAAYQVPIQILVHLSVQEKNTQFKNQNMLGFSGQFVSNALLPDGIGLGKSVSRGFGTVVQTKQR